MKDPNVKSRAVSDLAQAGKPTLHLLDVENMLGGLVSPERVAELWLAYQAAAPVRCGDHVIAGFGPRTAAAGVFDLPASVRKLVGADGFDSADRVLIDAVEVRHAVHRYDRVLIGSGDARFAALAWALRSQGLPVLLVDTKASRISWLLQRVCQGHVAIPASTALDVPAPRAGVAAGRPAA